MTRGTRACLRSGPTIRRPTRPAVKHSWGCPGAPANGGWETNTEVFRRHSFILGLTFAYQIVSTIGSAVAIGRDYRAEWLGLLSSGGEIWVDFLDGGGTALSPPVVSLVAIAAAAVVGLRADRAGRIATIVLTAPVAVNGVGARRADHLAIARTRHVRPAQRLDRRADGRHPGGAGGDRVPGVQGAPASVVISQPWSGGASSDRSGWGRREGLGQGARLEGARPGA